MSTRQMAHAYGSLGNQGGGGFGDLLSVLLGQSDISGGPTVDPVTHQVQANPYTGSSGFFGRRSRDSAAALNAQVLGPLLQEQQAGKTQTEIQKMMMAHQQELEKIKNQHALDLAQLESVKEAAKRLGISAKEYAGNIVAQNTANAQARLNLEGEALNPELNPDIRKNFKIGANISATGIPPSALSANVGQGGAARVPIISGGPESGTLIGGGNTRMQTVTPFGGFFDKNTGQWMNQKMMTQEQDIYHPPQFLQPINPANRQAVLGAPTNQPTVNANPLDVVQEPWDAQVPGQMPMANPLQPQRQNPADMKLTPGLLELLKGMFNSVQPIPTSPFGAAGF